MTLPRHSNRLTPVRVDYNTLYGGLVRALRTIPLRVGDRVLTFDEDGNEAEGVVEVVHPGGKVLRIRLDMETWRDGPNG